MVKAYATAVFVLGVLVTTLGCGKKDTNASEQHSNSGGTGTATAVGPSLNDEACRVEREDFSKHWSPCGDSWISRVMVDPGDLTQKPGFYEQWKNVSFVCAPEALTETDGLNGVTWKGAVGITYTAKRAYYLLNIPRSFLEKPPPIKVWTDWEPFPNSYTNPGLWNWHLECKGGKWTISENPYDFGGPVRSRYGLVKCDPTGATPFDPKASQE
jgi:hypothetical protein